MFEGVDLTGDGGVYGATQMALHSYWGETGRKAKALLLGSQVYIQLTFEARTILKAIGQPEDTAVDKLMGVEIYSSKVIPEDSIIPLGDPNYDAFYDRKGV
jgi:hypothetical protein